MEESKITKYVSIANLLLIITGGILGYFFVERYHVIAAIETVNASKASAKASESQAELNHAMIASTISDNVMKELQLKFYSTKEALELAEKNANVILNLAQKELVETEFKLKALDLELKKVNEELKRIDTKTNISLNLSTLLNDIQPAMALNCSIIKTGYDFIEINCEQKNIGNHKFRCEKFDLRILDLNGKELPKSSYKVVNSHGNTIDKGGIGSVQFTVNGVSFNPPSFQKIIINTKIKTIEEIVTITKDLMDGIVNRNIIDGLSFQSHTYTLWR